MPSSALATSVFSGALRSREFGKIAAVMSTGVRSHAPQSVKHDRSHLNLYKLLIRYVAWAVGAKCFSQ
jgi:hypothetical protein